MQWGGVLGLVSVGQLVVATVVMAVYSWQLTLLVLVCFIPLGIAVRWFAQRLAVAYGVVRERVGDVLGAVAESVVGAPTVRAYGVGARTAARIDTAIDRQYQASVQAQKVTAAVFVSGEFVAALANAAVVVVGVLLGLAGDISAGTLVAFLFLVTLFVAPVQTASEVLNEAQNAVAGFRRVLDVIDTEPDIRDPAIADHGDVRGLPAGPLGVRFDAVSFRYAPGARLALDGVDLTIEPRRRVAVVGETGSGQTTFAKLVTRLMDPVDGRVLLGSDAAGWVPLHEVAFASLRSRVVMVPQDGFLFDATVADNVRYGRPGMTDAQIAVAFEELGLGTWVEGLEDGVTTPVGQRGESLSSGERQLVAVARAYVADPDLLVLDEATSAVDPATEQRLTRALDRLTDGRTTLTIAHRLSTAERADEVLVVDAGHVVQRGTHDELVDADGPYARLHASWRRPSAGSPAPAVSPPTLRPCPPIPPRRGREPPAPRSPRRCSAWSARGCPRSSRSSPWRSPAAGSPAPAGCWWSCRSCWWPPSWPAPCWWSWDGRGSPLPYPLASSPLWSCSDTSRAAGPAGPSVCSPWGSR